ncbi:MAG: YggS family pyridoxal phosphate-dependent enzyme [Clostridiales bacterium]|jgi:pyridoxal phosphate enzyme (YggS family)|nr:YggS family pyridoxal phosphate-dependent enzyme [Clostridiales bacterium]
MIKDNLSLIKRNIEAACKNSPNNVEGITIIGVTKTIPVDRVKELQENGICDFGENRVQELMSKHEFFSNANWHLIGHLQTNKVKYIIDKVLLIHSVDSLKLAAEINKHAKQKNIIMDILLELNIAEEETKFGLGENGAYGLIKELKSFNNIRVKGLMTVAPFVGDPEENRPVFKKMYDIFNNIKEIKQPNLDISKLSMGMTNDYSIAVEEGSNMVRIGTGIFGSRGAL